MPSFFQRLNEHSSKFSPAHKTAAGFFLYHLDEAAFNTLQETADAVGMSTTTIIRFARQLGYEGYSDMQGDIRDILLKKSLPEIPELEDRSLSKTLTETFQVDMQNLELTLKAQKQSDLDQAVRYLAEGKRIYIVGMRTSYALANYAFIRLGQLRRNVQVITNLAGAYPEEIVSATKDDVVLAFAFPRISRLTVAMLNWLRSKQVPVVLDPGEVRQLLAHMPRPRYRAFFGLVYGCGLRKNEAIHLKVADIDGKRGGVHVRDAKGGKDRWVPLPPSVLEMLREHWKTHRNPTWLFPAPGRATGGADGPISETAVQDAVRVAARRAGLRKRVTTHTLRHSYATHLIEAGVPICQVQEHLGHSSLKTTTVYLHVTTSGREETCARLEQLLRGVLA